MNVVHHDSSVRHRTTSWALHSETAIRKDTAQNDPGQHDRTGQQFPKLLSCHGCLHRARLIHEGKHLPKATRSFGDPWKRMRRRNNAHSKVRSFAKKPSHVSLSAVTRR